MDAMQRQVSGYETCIPLQKKANLRRGKVHCALLPVWLLSTQWEGQNFLFAMNGQTGKMVGDLPLDRFAFWKSILIRTALIAGLLYTLMYLVVI